LLPAGSWAGAGMAGEAHRSAATNGTGASRIRISIEILRSDDQGNLTDEDHSVKQRWTQRAPHRWALRGRLTILPAPADDPRREDACRL
jgi:hypothetical protein